MQNIRKLKAMSTGQLASFISNLASCYNCPALKGQCIKSQEACRQAWQAYLEAGDEATAGSCEHDKVYENTLLLSYPAQQRWFCRKCGESGIDYREKMEDASYDEIKRARYPGCEPE